MQCGVCFLSSVFPPLRVKHLKLAGTLLCNRWPPRNGSRMCSRLLTESPVKLGENNELSDSGEISGGCKKVDTATLSPTKRKLDDINNLAGSGKTLSLIPASLLLEKGIDLIKAQARSSPEKKMKSRPFTVSIEGNIGSGKSTFLNYFSTDPGVDTHQEPIGLWTNLEGHNLLGKLYEDPKRWSFLFQSYVQLTRLNIHLQHSPNPVKLIERSLQNNRYCFLESGHDSGEITGAEYSILCEYYDLLESNLDIGVDLIVYLRTSPEIVHDRMVKRGRTEEADVPLDYLKKVHNYYERWLLHHEPRTPPAPVLVIDADQDLEAIKREYERKKSVIMGEKALQS